MPSPTISFTLATDEAVLAELGRRARRARLDQNLTQASLADRASVHRTTIRDLEHGRSVTTATWVQVLRALGALQDLEAILPDPGPSPIELARSKRPRRQRATGSRSHRKPPMGPDHE